MFKYFIILSVLFIAIAFNHSLDDQSATAPSPQGDTRMGADAANSGTDVTDQELQAQEDQGQMNQTQEPPEKIEIQEENTKRPMP